MLTLPPVRERGDDLRLIAQALLTRLAREHDLTAPALTAGLLARLRAHPWPGNVRELKNALERALLLSPAGELSADELLPPAETRVQHDGPIPFPAAQLHRRLRGRGRDRVQRRGERDRSAGSVSLPGVCDA